MKGCLIGVLFFLVMSLVGTIALLGWKNPEMRKAFVVFLPGKSDQTSSGNSAEVAVLPPAVIPKQSLTEKQSHETPGGASTRTSSPKRDGFNQYWDADKAFAVDELFAVTSKNTIRREFYTDHFDKNPFGNSKTKFHEPVYIVRAMGRETRENYLFIVPREFYDAAKIYQKFTKVEMSNFEYFLSEDKLQAEIFHRRFRARMID